MNNLGVESAPTVRVTGTHRPITNHDQTPAVPVPIEAEGANFPGRAT